MSCASTRKRSIQALLRLVVGSCTMLAATAQAYDGPLHQELTFIAARAFNGCIEEGRLAAKPLTPLQVRYVAKTNRRQSQSNLFKRIFRWNYYDRGDQSAQSWFWVIDTRFHGHFREVNERLAAPRSQAAFFSDLGRMVNYVQNVTSPAHAVPVYTGRFWRFSLSDRFDGFDLDREALVQSLDGACENALNLPGSYEEILQTTAARTLDAVESPVAGMPAQWSAFWRPNDNPSNFGEYGRAGNNFGRPVQFRCGGGQRCVLLEDDPLYRSFALARHQDAVVSTMRAFLLAHRSADVETLVPGG